MRIDRALGGVPIRRNALLGGEYEILEGEWPEWRHVVVEFPSAERAREWYNSPEYQRLAKLRLAQIDERGVEVDGLHDGVADVAGRVHVWRVDDECALECAFVSDVFGPHIAVAEIPAMIAPQHNDRVVP